MKKFVVVFFACVLCLNVLCHSQAEAYAFRKGYCYFLECQLVTDQKDYQYGKHADRGNGTYAYQVFWDADDGALYLSVHGYENGTIYGRDDVSRAVDTLVFKNNLTCFRDRLRKLYVICCHPDKVGRSGRHYSKLLNMPIEIVGYREGFSGVITQGERRTGGNYRAVSGQSYLVEVCFCDTPRPYKNDLVALDKNVKIPKWAKLMCEDVARLENYPINFKGKRINYCYQ